MNNIVIDKRVFLQSKKRSNTKTTLPQIKCPIIFNVNGSNIFRKMNDDFGPKDHSLRLKSYHTPLSNILISKRITPLNPEESSHKTKRKLLMNYIPKQESQKKIILQYQHQTEEVSRKTDTSLSHKIQRNNNQRDFVILPSEQIKISKTNRAQQYTVVIGKGNNNEDLVRKILLERKIWKQIKWGEGIPNLKWVFFKQKHNYKKMWSFTQTRAINHFQFNQELTTKDNLIRNLQLYCETRKMEVFNLTPVTFIIDFDDEYCEYNIKQFLSFFIKNDPRKNTNLRKNGSASFNFLNKFQPYMAWQNSDIKKKVNILSRPVNNSTYYSNDPEPGYIWLLKPTGLNRGRGIQIFDNLESLEKLFMDFLTLMNRKNFRENKEKQKKKQNKTELKGQKNDTVKPLSQTEVKSDLKQTNSQQKRDSDTPQQNNEQKFCKQNFKLSTCSFVIQKYVQRPFLIQKRKFDIRVWVLLTQNLNLFFFKEGYIRTSAEEFQVKDINNYFIHLTNNAIQKNSSSYGLFQNGNQLSFKDLNNIIGEEQTLKIWERMKQIAFMTYSSVNKKINQNHRKFCFELFGLDFIIDEQLKVWLIQINENPCIECSSPLLENLIPRMINDAFKLTLDQIFTDKKSAEKAYPVPNYSNSENLWELLGQLGPNLEYTGRKIMGKQSPVKQQSSLKETLQINLKQYDDGQESVDEIEQKSENKNVGNMEKEQYYEIDVLRNSSITTF